MFGFGMLKKLTVIGIVAMVVGGVFFGREVVSYATTSRHAIQEAVRDQIPIEFEIKRARDLINDIMPELQANMKLVAKEEVEIDALESDIGRMQKSLADEKKRMGALAASLKSGKETYTFGSSTYSRSEVEKDLARRFERYRSSEMVFAGKERLLATRRQALRSAMEKLKSTQNAKALLEDQVRSLEAQFRVIHAAQASSKLHLDDSKLAKAERLLDELKKRLEVSKRVLESEAEFTQDIPVDEAQQGKIADEVLGYFKEAEAAE